MAYDLCSARHCNICLLLQTEQLNNNKNGVTLKIVSAQPIAETPSKLQKCSGCQLVLYCSAAHQHLDWPLHRDFCRATQKIMARYQVRHPYLLNGTPKDASSMQHAILQVKYLLRSALGRALHFQEEELSSFPAYCAVCFSLRRLQHCPYCQAISYCSAAHMQADAERHSQQCGLLQLYYCVHKLQPLPEQQPIAALYRRVPALHKTDLVDALQCVTLKQLPALPTATLQDYQLFASAADFSCVGTVCYALTFMEMRYYDHATFAIFIVGASVEQHLWFQQIHTKFFFLQFPQIIRLELYFIGPEVPGTEQQRIDVYEFQCVERTVLYSSYHGLFQHFCQQHNIKPSLIISFNCGFSEYTHMQTDLKEPKSSDIRQQPLATAVTRDTWCEGLVEMLQTFDLPIVFTSFTSLEADFDYAALLCAAKTDRLAIHVERIFSVKQNPYRDLRPLRNWQLSDEEQIYYRNGYVQAVRTRLEF